LNTSTDAALVVDDLAAVLGAHSLEKPELAGAFDFADAVWVMHDNPSL